MPQRRSIHPDTLIQILLLITIGLLFLASMILAVNGRIGSSLDTTPWDIVPRALMFCSVGLVLYQLGSLLMHALKWQSKEHLVALRLLGGYVLMMTVLHAILFDKQELFAWLHLLLGLVFIVMSPVLSHRFHQKKVLAAATEILDDSSLFQ